MAMAADIRRHDAVPRDLVAFVAGRDRHIVMNLLVIESYRRNFRELDKVKASRSLPTRAEVIC
jgi:hypothetical protein